MHYTERYSPTPAAASIRMLMATAVAEDGELWHLYAEQSSSKADIDEIYIKALENIRSFRGQQGC